MMPSATTKTDLRLYGSEGRWAGCTIRAVSRLRSPAVFLPALLAAGLMSAGWTEGGTPATAPATDPGKAQAAPQASAAAPASSPAPVSAPASTSAPAPAPGPSSCELHPLAGKWVGSCGRILDETPKLTLAPATAITTGVWRRDAKPTAVWAGTMTVEEVPNAPLELEVYAGDSGVLRTVFGWFAVSGLTQAGQILRFELDAAREVPPSALDREILERAAAILSSESVWNRADNRKCPPAATSWSLYCAMERATIEVTGAFHHRRPALELVRQIVDERSAGRPYHHRLMDYNNDPTTRLADVRGILADALSRLGLRIPLKTTSCSGEGDHSSERSDEQRLMVG